MATKQTPPQAQKTPTEATEQTRTDVHPFDVLHGIKKETGHVIRERHPIDDEQPDEKSKQWANEMQDFNPMRPDEQNRTDDANLTD